MQFRGAGGHWFELCMSPGTFGGAGPLVAVVGGRVAIRGEEVQSHGEVALPLFSLQTYHTPHQCRLSPVGGQQQQGSGGGN